MTGSAKAAARHAVAAAVHVDAPAKLNLYLHVVGRRSDGYHLVETLVAFVGVGDQVSVAPDTAIELVLAGPFAGALATEADNIVLRAARALREHMGTRAGAAITLTKRLPVAAGLGGGSADAAATLTALARLWGPARLDSAIERMALDLGADVPVCLLGRPAMVGGVGEVVMPAPPLPAAHVVLANPGTRLATADVYAAFDAQPATSRAPLAPGRPALSGRSASELAGLLAERANDLEPAARRLEPAIAEVLEFLGGQRGALIARMSGSGPTCFALFARSHEATAAAAAITEARPHWWVASAPLLSGAARA